MKNFGIVPNKDWEFLFLYDKIHPKYRIVFFVFRYIYGYKENREKGYFTVRRLQDLANYLKMHRKMLWKYLKQLEEEGIIWRQGKRIGIGKWSEVFRYIPEKVTKEVMMGPVVVSERITEFPRYQREDVANMATNSRKNVAEKVINNRNNEDYVPIKVTKPDSFQREQTPPQNKKEPFETNSTSDLFEYQREIKELPPDMKEPIDMDDEDDFSSWTEKEIFGKFYPYREFFPQNINHPEKVDEFFINTILPEVTRHYPGYTFNPANPNLRAFFREYEKILKLKAISPHQTKITI